MRLCFFYIIDEDLNWRKACIEREETHRVWSEPREYYNHTMVREGFFAAVDVVHLMKVQEPKVYNYK